MRHLAASATNALFASRPFQGRAGAAKPLLLALAASTMLVPASAHANSIILSGDYIKIGLNDKGTLGYGGNTSPGILYDGTGTGTFNPAYDYLTPGTPFEGFVVEGTDGATFRYRNNNSSSVAGIAGTLTDYSGIAYNGTTYDKRAVWSGNIAGLFDITNDYYFNSDSQKIEISTTISALTDLTGLAFSRQIDPDAVAASGDSSATTNIRGTDGVPASDLVYAEALVSKYVIGLYTNSTITHNSAVTGWTQDTASYLAGTNIGNGDNTIGLGFDIGSLLTGESIVINYSYIFGTNIAAAVGGPNNITGTHDVGDLIAGTISPVFDGGTLVFTSPLVLATALSLEAGGGGIDTQGNAVTLSGILSGTGGLTKTGAGTLTLTGANSYSGGTAVTEGRLIGDSQSLQGDIANDGTVEFAQGSDGSYAGALSGTGGLVKSGSGTLTLTGANSHAGGTSVTGGTLVATGNAAIGTGPLTIGAAEFRAGGELSLANAVTLTDSGSTVNSAGHDIVLSGNLSGPGTLNKTGSGTLTLTGANSQNGIVLAGGVLAFDSDAALGIAGSVVRIEEDTTLRTLADFTISHDLFINDTQRARFDSNGHDIVMAGDITGQGNIEKIGAGTLTLTGSNERVTINVVAGRVVAQSQAAIGGGGGDIFLHQDGGFTAGTDMNISQNVHVVGTNSTFDTGAHDVTLAGSVDGNACFTKTGAGRLSLMAAGGSSEGACIEQGTLAFNNVFQGNVVVGQQGIAGGSGQIAGNVEVNGILSPGNSPGVLVVAGNVTQAAGSTLLLDIDGTTAGTGAGHHDMLVLTGQNSVYTAGGTISPTLRGITGDATNSFTPQLGQTFTVVSAEGGVEGSFAALAQPGAGLAADTRFDVVYRDTAILLAVTPLSYAGFATGDNGRSAGQALDGLRGPAGVRDISATGRLFDGLAGLDAGQLALSMEQLSGSIHASAMDAATLSLRAARAGVGQHLDGADGGRNSLWGSFNRDHVRVKADRSGRGYSAESTTLLVGLDTQATDTLLLGAAFAYGTSDVSTSGLGKSDDDHYQAMLYGRWASRDSYVRGVLSFAIDDYRIDREVALSDGSRTLASRPDGFSWGVDVEAGHRLDLGGVSLTPFAGIAYDRVERDGFAETGDAAVALRFTNDRRNAWQLRGGAKLGTRFAMGGATLAPYAQASVTRELADEATRLDPLLGGVAMTVGAPSMGKTGVQGGAGVEALLSERVALSLGYRYKDMANARQHSANAGISIRW